MLSLVLVVADPGSEGVVAIRKVTLEWTLTSCVAPLVSDQVAFLTEGLAAVFLGADEGSFSGL